VNDETLTTGDARIHDEPAIATEAEVPSELPMVEVRLW